MLQFSEITGDWSDRPTYIVGGGSSLTGFDFKRLDGRTVGCNRAAFDADCDVLVSLDQHFCRMQRDEIQHFVDEGREAILVMPPSEVGHKQVEGATYVYRVRNQGLSDDPARVYGLHTGYAALGVCYLKKAKEIGLLGMDMVSGSTVHWHGSYPWQNKNSNRFMNKWSMDFGKAAQQLEQAGINVVNFVGIPKSKLTEFQTRPLEDLA